MLILGRKLNESIIIGNDIKIKICKINHRQIRIGITAPKETPVYREEIYDEVLQGRQSKRNKVV